MSVTRDDADSGGTTLLSGCSAVSVDGGLLGLVATGLVRRLCCGLDCRLRDGLVHILPRSFGLPALSTFLLDVHLERALSM